MSNASVLLNPAQQTNRLECRQFVPQLEHRLIDIAGQDLRELLGLIHGRAEYRLEPAHLLLGLARRLDDFQQPLGQNAARQESEKSTAG